MGQCFLYGNGGNDRLKLRIFSGTSAPSNPQDNDIWVKTSIAIPSWEFSETEAPTWGMSKGFVYFTSTYVAGYAQRENTGLNFLKKNTIYTNLLGCHQYDGSAWHNMDAYIYHSGWHQFSATRIYLTNGGDKCPSVTGGWSEIRWYWDSNATGNTPTATWTDNGVALTAPRVPGPGGLIVTKNTINLTNADSIIINCADVSENSWCIISKATGDSFNANEVARVQLANGTNVLDVSGVNGSVYVGLVAYYNAKVTVKQTYII